MKESDPFNGLVETLCFLLGMLIGVLMANSWWKWKAVQANVAHYEIVDPNTGRTGFRWRNQ